MYNFAMEANEALPIFAKVAAEYGLDKHQLAEQGWRESQWNAFAVGNNRQLGLMQVPPAVWGEWAPRLKVYDPFDAESNIRLAAAYLQDLRQRLATQLNTRGDQWLLAAYHWGFDPVSQLLRAGKRWEDVPVAEQDYAIEILTGAETRALIAAEPRPA